MQATRANALTVLTYGCIIDGVVKMPLRASIFTSWLNRHIQMKKRKTNVFLKRLFFLLSATVHGLERIYAVCGTSCVLCVRRFCMGI